MLYFASVVKGVVYVCLFVDLMYNSENILIYKVFADCL